MSSPGMSAGRGNLEPPKLPDQDLLKVARENAQSTEDFFKSLDQATQGVREELASQGSHLDRINETMENAALGISKSGDNKVEASEEPQKPGLVKRFLRSFTQDEALPPESGGSGNKVITGKKEPSIVPSKDAVKPKLEHILTGPNNAERTRLIGLLWKGNVEEFNNTRPSGKIDLRGLDFSGLKLQGADFRHVDLSRSNLQRCDLRGAQFQHAVLDRADFSRTNLSEAKLFSSSARYTDFRDVVEAAGAEFQNAVLRSSDFTNGNFSGANFTDAVMITATCTNAKFRGPATHMERVCLAGAVLSGANFEGANLVQARLFQANGEDVSFAGANLTEAEAVQSHFTSSKNKSAGGKVLETSFEGAWVRGFVHNGALSSDLLKGSVSDRTPPEGMFEGTHEPDPGKILINGVPGTDKVLYDAAMLDLNELVGMEDAKRKVKELTYFVEASQARQGFGLPAYKIWLHKVLLGPPGVGKTTLARIMAQLEHSLALRKKGHLVETDKSGLIAGYAGQTLGKTTEVIDEALDGTLLIDEAYALGQSKDDAYAKDATAVIVKRMWDDRERLTVTFAGYEKETEEFVNSNPGMRSRIGMWLRLKPFSSGELVDIFKLNLDKQVTRYDSQLLGAVSVLLELTRAREGNKFGNARTVEKVINDLNYRNSARLKMQNLMQDEQAHKTPPLVEDLPFADVAQIDFSQLPPLTEFTWVDSAGNSLSINELPLDGSFPALSPESIELAAAIVNKPN